MLNVSSTPFQIKQLLLADGSGKSITSQDIRNIKSKARSIARGSDTEGQVLVDTIRKLLCDDVGAAVKVLECDNELQAVCWQTNEMLDKYRRYGEVLFVDTTYKLNIERFPLLVFLVEDGVGCGIPVLFAFVKNETSNILTSIVEWFCSQNDGSITRVVIVDKDLTLLSALQKLFKDSNVLLCHFHVLKYIRKKIISLNVSSDVKSELLQCVFKMTYANTDAEYDTAYKHLLNEQTIPDSFKTYFTDNWHSCKSLWCTADRKNLLTLGNNTNNRIENFNKQLKRIVKPSMHLSESLRILIEMPFSRANDMGYKQYREIGSRIDASTSLPAIISANLTILGTDLVATQYKKFIQHEEYATLREKTNEVIVCRDNRQYTITNENRECSCSFFMNFRLPCWHIFFARSKQCLSLFDSNLESIIPLRWIKKELLNVNEMFVNPMPFCENTVITKKQNKKTLYEEDRYLNARKETDLLACYLATCGGSEYAQKLHQIHYLLQLWQAGRTVCIDACDNSLTDNPGEHSEDLDVEESPVVKSEITITPCEGPLTESQRNVDIERGSHPTETEELEPFNIPSCSIKTNIRWKLNVLRNKLHVPVVKKCKGRPKGTKQRVFRSKTRIATAQPNVDKPMVTGENAVPLNQINILTNPMLNENSTINSISSLVNPPSSLSSVTTSQSTIVTSVTPINTSFVTPLEENTASSSLSTVSAFQSAFVKSLASSSNKAIAQHTLRSTKNAAGLAASHMKIIQSSTGWLTDEHMTASARLLKELSCLHGFNDTVLQQNYSWVIPKRGETYIQFLHRSSPPHWFVISNKFRLNDDNSIVDIYDSMNLEPNTQVIKDICNFINCENKSLTINVVNVQQQTNGSDCGVLAIAYATSLVFGGNPANIYYTCNLRKHLSACLVKGLMEEFPCRMLTRKPAYCKTFSLQLYCICRCIDDGRKMILCSSCKEWFHFDCVNVKKIPLGNWSCSKCQSLAE